MGNYAAPVAKHSPISYNGWHGMGFNWTRLGG
jgi:hypothetical protein